MISADEYKQVSGMFSSHHESEHEGIIKAKELGFIPGTRIAVKYGIGPGVITKFREQVGGLYCGIRYPVDVMRDSDGLTFGYNLDQLQSIEEYEKEKKVLDEEKRVQAEKDKAEEDALDLLLSKYEVFATFGSGQLKTFNINPTNVMVVIEGASDYDLRVVLQAEPFGGRFCTTYPISMAKDMMKKYPGFRIISMDMLMNLQTEGV